MDNEFNMLSYNIQNWIQPLTIEELRKYFNYHIFQLKGNSNWFAYFFIWIQTSVSYVLLVLLVYTCAQTADSWVKTCCYSSFVKVQLRGNTTIPLTDKVSLYIDSSTTGCRADAYGLRSYSYATELQTIGSEPITELRLKWQNRSEDRQQWLHTTA